MKNNISATDRSVRLAVGVVLIAVSVASFAELIAVGPVISGLVLLVGVVLVVTGVVRMCPIYRLLGIDTSSSRESGRLEGRES